MIQLDQNPKEVSKVSHPIQQLHQHYPVTPPKQSSNKTTLKFSDVLSNAEGLKISKHAKQRLKERNINIDSKQWQTISNKMNEAKKKGVTDSLVVMKNAALLVSTENNTIVTAMNQEEANSRIFTNINGTILINE